MRRPRGPGGRFLTAAEQAAAASSTSTALDTAALDPQHQTLMDPDSQGLSNHGVGDSNGFGLDLEGDNDVEQDLEHDLEYPEDPHDIGEGWEGLPEQENMGVE